MSIEAQNTSDLELLEGIRHADKIQVERLYDQCLPGIVRYIKMNNGSEDDAKDIFQDAVMVLYKKLKDTDIILTTSLQSYLLAISRNLWLTTLRNNRFMKMDEAQENIAGVDDDIVTAMETVQKEKLFDRHLARLGEKCRLILRFFFEKVPMAAIAARLGTTESYIKKRKFTCKEQLIESIVKDPEYKALYQ